MTIQNWKYAIDINYVAEGVPYLSHYHITNRHDHWINVKRLRRSWIYHWGDISKYWCRCCLTFLALFWSSELHFFTKRLHNSQLCSTSNQLTSEKTELKNILPFGCEMQMKFRYAWQDRMVLYCLLNFIFKLYQKYLSLHVVIQYGCSSYASLPVSYTHLTLPTIYSV